MNIFSREIWKKKHDIYRELYQVGILTKLCVYSFVKIQMRKTYNIRKLARQILPHILRRTMIYSVQDNTDYRYIAVQNNTVSDTAHVSIIKMVHISKSQDTLYLTAELDIRIEKIYKFYLLE